MRPPRRVPWASKAELAELYDLIFSPAATDETRQAALSRMAVYISSPSCPAFLHLLHTLVGALALPYPAASAHDAGVLRMTYAMAVVRFVNGMVDPLQTGPYARPISHLAASLGLPPSLVALRHRATHEDLPPLPLLRRAMEQAVDYLHRNSFLPLLSSSASSSGGRWDRRARAEGLVSRWKKVVKARVRAREVGMANESGQALGRLKREVEGADVEELVEAVVRVGLVPVARKKRPSKSATAPPQESLLVWTPLLSQLAELHTSAVVASQLSEQLVSAILETAPRHAPPAETADDAAEQRKEVASYRWTLATWLFTLWSGRVDALQVTDDDKTEAVRQLARELFHDDEVLRRIYATVAETTDAAPSLDSLAELLPAPAAAGDEDEDDSDAELDGLEVNDGDEPEQLDVSVEASLEAMEANVRSLERKLASRRPEAESGATGGDNPAAAELAPGWRRVEGWKACPIGVWA
ncbi:Protein LAS1 [Vanrija pseudolonga]|uniref:Protein LAS1 n=1 Tax=Vanrija pseudolonga TaxID=143232 RepID=A0AAF0Y4H8_9TREE|nr:Protein LAS1 [Vanrija pseudolonga]